MTFIGFKNTFQQKLILNFILCSLNRKTIYNLKKDATDKLKAQNIDEYALSLKATDDTLPGFSGPVGIDTR